MGRLVTYPGATVVGIGVVTSNEAEADPVRGKIPGLWGRFYGDGILGTIPGKTAPLVPLGVYTDYQSDHTGPYRLLIGAAVDADAPTPIAMMRTTIPAGECLLFEAEGDMPRVVIETWRAVWKYFAAPAAGHARAYTTDFEVHSGERTVEIYVSVK